MLLSDGRQEGGKYEDAHLEAKAKHLPIHTVALGRSADRELLERIAGDTGGVFLEADRDEDLQRLYASIAGRIAGGHAIRTQTWSAATASAAKAVASCFIDDGTPAQAGLPLNCAPTITPTVPLATNAALTRLRVAKSVIVILRATRV